VNFIRGKFGSFSFRVRAARIRNDFFRIRQKVSDPQRCLAEEGVLVVLHVHVGVVEELDVDVAVEGAVHVPHHGFVLEAFAQGHHQLLGGHPVPTYTNIIILSMYNPTKKIVTYR
jgi:hypothetical protein